MCKTLNIALEVKKKVGQNAIDAMVQCQHDCLAYEHAKKHMSKHSRVYSSYQMDIGSEAFKRTFVTNRTKVTTALKRTLKTIDCDGRESEKLLKGDLDNNVTLCLQNSFCRNRETNVGSLTCC